ncbi:Beta-lactamase [Madurella fahalii]|uniref:Beta-lactamase n=1 Tax=Madurella fahalii TaxID=1157608 RepID=A0ABQ0GKJ4_9PEZI
MLSFSVPALGRALALFSVLGSVLPATAASIPANVNDSLETRAAVAWQARHGLTPATYQSTFDSLVDNGYRLSYVSGYTINNAARYAAVWDKSASSAWQARHGMTAAQYQSTFDNLLSQGYRLRLVNGYAVGNSARFAAIWDKSAAPGAWIARHGMTAAQYQTNFNNFVGQGYRLVHVSGYAQGGQARYAAIWEKSSDKSAWVARHGLTGAQYQKAFNDYVSQGYRLVRVSGYVVNNVAYYAAIWDKAATPAWQARHGLTAAQYQSEFNKLVGQGYRLSVVSGYTLNSNQDRFAAIWVKNT